MIKRVSFEDSCGWTVTFTRDEKLWNWSVWETSTGTPINSGGSRYAPSQTFALQLIKITKKGE